MTHPGWCSADRCEAGDAGPGSSRAHRSAVTCVGGDGHAAMLWQQQEPDGPVVLAVMVSARSVGGPVALLDRDAARGLLAAIAACVGR